VNQPLPASSDKVKWVATSVFRTEWPFNAHNYGHLMMEAIIPVFLYLDMLRQLDVSERDLIFLTSAGCDKTPDGRAPECEKVLSKMLTWFSKHEPAHMKVPVFKADYEGFDLVCFKNFFLGSLHTSYHMGPIPHNEVSTTIRNFRRYVYRVSGIEPDFRPSKHQILILAKPHFLVNGRAVSRTVENMEEHLATYRSKYPGADVVTLDIKSPTPAQVELLSRTTVLISEWGGTSFCMVFLPPGAELIIFEDPSKGHMKAGFMNEGNNGMESTLIWQYVSDISGGIQQYRFQDGEFTQPENTKDSPTKINPHHLLPYIDRAMYRINARLADKAVQETGQTPSEQNGTQ